MVPATNQPTTGASRCPPSTQCAKNIFFFLSFFLHVQVLFPLLSCPLYWFDLEMSNSFYLMWKKNTEINYLIFFFYAVNWVILSAVWKHWSDVRWVTIRHLKELFISAHSERQKVSTILHHTKPRTVSLHINRQLYIKHIRWPMKLQKIYFLYTKRQGLALSSFVLLTHNS